MNKVNCLTFVNEKQIKPSDYLPHFRHKLGNNGILFLQETHSTFNGENILKNDFNKPIFYSHGKSQIFGEQTSRR